MSAEFVLGSKMFKKFRTSQRKKMSAVKFEDTPVGIKLITAGTAACIGDAATFPFDTAKVRLQVQGEGTGGSNGNVAPHYRGVFSTIMTIAKEGGPKSLYNGLSAGLQRQMCFASIRLGLYETVKNFYQELISGTNYQQNVLDFLTRISAGITTGAMAVLLAQPTDVVKVRFQAQRGSKERYKSTTEAYKTIFKYEGVRGLWKGTYPNVARNSIVNVSEIVCYDIVKDSILKNNLMRDNIYCHFTSALIAGFCTTVVASPVDVIKTRYMNSSPEQYRSAINCAFETGKKEGLIAFYKGFTPSFTRLVSWNIVMWITYEKLKAFATKMFNERS